MKWAGHMARTEDSRNAFKILIRKPMSERALERLRCRWYYNIRMEVGIKSMIWILLAENSDW